jgi:hypothetical protein
MKQLESKGLLVREGAIVDATIIESSRRLRQGYGDYAGGPERRKDGRHPLL